MPKAKRFVVPVPASVFVGAVVTVFCCCGKPALSRRWRKVLAALDLYAKGFSPCLAVVSNNDRYVCSGRTPVCGGQIVTR